ncbi:uncharacterized protein BX664DRAFT_319406 [Halteromyces radiatus]|uniref:uncharacterized protein n=1 Tax=Halteromyces radiatus TaxID=101107 RepID=UPI00221F6985|nr:uncharacterized protein BX664DRAFT_319406 [Halteromyces radiatus]KAI8098716.1 hypothetical protein BX664DRAFT_319406 [Halteromyces radiatus]
MMPPFSHDSSTSPSTPLSPSIDTTFRRHHLSASDMIAVDLGQNSNSNIKYYKDKPPSRFFYFPSRTARKYRQQPRWLKILVLMAGILFLFGYVPFFKFVKEFPPLDSSSPLPIQDKVIQQQQQPIYPETVRDQIILYRIIGNDLPPRHKEGQTLSNLQFILEHEPDFPNTRKIFLLNRISNTANEATIIRLLDRHNKEYIRLPFEEDVYRQLDFRLEDFTEPDFLHSDDYRRYSKVAKLRALDYTYHDKNLYAMNNNGGRNTAIEHARTIKNAKWIMPFDGNCYLSNNGFQEIKTQLDNHGATTKYFIVPMTRLLNNSVLLNNLDERPKAPEEPQIIFRHDSTEEYNLNMRYGRRSKLELLWTLGALENRRLSRPTVPWEPSERPYSQDKGNFRSIGWVYRLFSGNPQQEENKKEASSIRAFNRLLAIQSSLDSLDEGIARRYYRQDKMFLYNEKEMANIRYSYWNKDQDITAVVKSLMARADTIIGDLYTYYPSVVGEHDMMTTNDNSDEESDVTEKNTSPPISTLGPERLGTLSQNVTILTLAHYFVGNENYGKMAANMIRVHLLEEKAMADEDQYSSARRIPDDSHLLDFLSDQGYSFPSLGRLATGTSTKHHHAAFSSPSTILANNNNNNNNNNNRLLNTSDLTKTDLSSLLDCVRLLRHMQLLTHKEYIYMQAMTADFLEYLVTSPAGIHLAQMTDHRGVLYDLQVTSLAAFTNDVRLLLRVANRCRMRIGKQFDQDGEQPYQLLRLQSMMMMPQGQTVLGGKDTPQPSWQALLHYQSLNLQYWTSLARGIQNTNVAKDIWHYTAKNGASISHSVTRHLQTYAQQASQWNDEDKAWAQSRLRPLLMMAKVAFEHAAQSTSAQPDRDQADRQWINTAVEKALFGNPFTVEQEPTSLDHQDPVMNETIQAILDDQSKGRPSISPFWMLSTV